MKGTKANARARVTGGRHGRAYEAPFMHQTKAEKQARNTPARSPLEREHDPRGFPYMIATGGAAMPCYVRPSQKKE